MNAQTEYQNLPATYSSQTSALVLDPENIASMMKLAETMVASKVTVPDHLKNSGDCLAVIMQAMQWGMNPFAVAQKTHLVNGKLGYEAQLVNAVVTASGAIKGHFHYEYRGDGEKLECRVGAVLSGDNEITWNEWLMLESVTTRNSPLWKTNKKQQLGYLQVKNWSRAFAPGAILGVYTPDELEDIDAPPARIRPSSSDLLPEYSDADFQKNLPTYRKAIEAGRKTADDIITTVSTKYTVTKAQQDTLREIKPIEPKAQEQAEPAAAEGAQA
jgi:hypothetical protein